MKIAWLCASYNRPRLLGNLIWAFEQQTYPDRELWILEDSGLLESREGLNWHLIGSNHRFNSVSHKRNILATMAEDADVYMITDDDDYYFPWATASVANAYEGGAFWTRASQAMEWDMVGETLTRHETFARNSPQEPAYGGCWTFSRRAFQAVGGYTEPKLGDDWTLANSIREKFGLHSDTISEAFPLPWYIYSRGETGTYHSSEMGNEFYDLAGKLSLEDPTAFKIKPLYDYEKLVIPDLVLPRKF